MCARELQQYVQLLLMALCLQGVYLCTVAAPTASSLTPTAPAQHRAPDLCLVLNPAPYPTSDPCPTP
jgi:hypothetical protein